MGPKAQHNFNGCHDERVKSERGDTVSSTGKMEEGREAVRRKGCVKGHWERTVMNEQVCDLRIMERLGKKQEK